MNQVITDVPDGTIEAHLDTSSGRTQLELGHLTDPDLTVTTDYATARAIFVLQDAAAAMQAFMSGKIRVEGDMGKLMLLQAQAMQPDPLAAEVAERVKAITRT
ncbi:MAG: SCP2 sterol-binding domain-containing protein [Acidimicrobiales bacterium]|nr:SCP2 sterol-binding domain-containing protein [Acidimicrobiales bacterium]